MSDQHLPTPSLDGARCAIHPDRAAERTCVRCGNYLCSACQGGDQTGLCLTCASRLGSHGFPFSRDRYTLDGLVSFAFSRWKEHWLPLLLVFGGSIVVIYGANLIGDGVFELVANRTGETSGLHSPLHPARLVFQFAVSVLQLTLLLVACGMYLDILRHGKTEPEAALRRVRQLPQAIVLLLVVYMAFAIDFGLPYGLFLALGGFQGGGLPWVAAAGTWLVLVPVCVYVWLGVMFAMLVLLVDPQSTAFSAIRGMAFVSGHRLPALGVCTVAVLIAVLGGFACCVGLLATVPIASLIFCALFLALSNTGGALPTATDA